MYTYIHTYIYTHAHTHHAMLEAACSLVNPLGSGVGLAVDKAGVPIHSLLLT
jgi:hypothetical protein